MIAPRTGIFTALWIPLGQDGRLERHLLRNHLDWQKERGVHGILALGSTGEFARMLLPQREEVLAAIVELASPLPVIANVSSIRLDEVCALGRAAKRLGAVGVAIMPPIFYPLAQEDLLEFFLRAAEQIDLPVYLYNYPEVTGNRIGLEVIGQFADRAEMAGIKQSGAELSYHSDLIALGNEKDFSVFTAADPLLARYLEMGAKGCMGGLPNFVPEFMVEVFRCATEGRLSDAQQASRRLREVGEIIAPLHLPLNVRSGLQARGFDPGAFKTVYSPATQKTCDEASETLRRAFADWCLPAVSSISG